MREFLKAFGNNFVTAMSGLFSVVFWAVVAVGEALSFPISVRVGFIFAAAGSMYYAAFLVWKSEVGKRKVLEERIAELEAKETSHSEELHRARTSDPHRNAVRHEVEQLIREFQELIATADNAIPAGILYPLEIRAFQFLNQHRPAYRHFNDDYRIHGSWETGDMLTRDDVSKRCTARIKRLSDVLGMLS